MVCTDSSSGRDRIELSREEADRTELSLVETDRVELSRRKDFSFLSEDEDFCLVTDSTLFFFFFLSFSLVLFCLRGRGLSDSFSKIPSLCMEF
jgi:hypothetical protein